MKSVVNKRALSVILISMLVLCSADPQCMFIEELISQRQETPQNSTNSVTGKEIYVKHCLTCHQTDGSGVPNMFPPIQKSDWVNGDKNKLIKVVLNGLQGDIEVNGDPFSQVMPKQDSLTDVQIAQLLTYIRQNFGNKADSVHPADVKNLRRKK